MYACTCTKTHRHRHSVTTHDMTLGSHLRVPRQSQNGILPIFGNIKESYINIACLVEHKMLYGSGKIEHVQDLMLTP